MDLDLPDEELVRRAQRADGHHALQALALRCWGLIKTWIAQEAHAQGDLSREDLRDAEQHAFLAFLDAVKSFDPVQDGRVRRCSFRSFLYGKAKRSFLDFAKHIRRVRKLYQCARGADTRDVDLDKIPAVTEDRGLPCEPLEDPALAAECAERTARIREEVARLDPRERLILEYWAEGYSLHEIASA